MKAIDLYTDLNALGIKFEPIGYVKAPAYPYGIYADDVEIIQPDTPSGARLVKHEITISIFDPDLEILNKTSKILDAWINSIPLNYRKRVAYVIDEDHYSTTYTLNYTTKERDV